MKEYRRFNALRFSGFQEYFIYSLVFDHCYTGNPNTLDKNLPAGIPIAIGQMILWLSGDCESKTLKDDILKHREKYPKDSVLEHMRRIIFTAWPSYTEEDLDNLDYQKLIHKFVVAESLIKYRNADFEYLNVKKIHDGSGVKKTPGVRSADELSRENRELNQAMGDQVHPLDKSPDDLTRLQQRNKGRITRTQAKALDRIRR